MKIKTSKAQGLQLDWGLSIALGHEKTMYLAHCGSVHGRDKDRGWTSVEHVNASLFLALIKEYCIQLFPFYDFEDVRWDADIRPDVRIVNCETPEQAVARCVISMRLGEYFECPDELGVQS